jgi:sulfate permease, SulP family
MRPKLLTTLRTYTPALFRADLFAGITVAMVALPLSLAIAIASGAEPRHGLITAIVGGLLISLLGGSRVQIGGPTGAFIVVVYAVIAEHGLEGLVLATFMAGLILLAAGALRIGRLIDYVPEPVVDGFTIGIAVIIATSQLANLFGLTVADLPADMIEKIRALWSARSSVNWSALGVGLGTGALIVVLRRAAPRLPGLILAVAAATFAAKFLVLPVETIGSRFGELPRGLPMPEVPTLSLERITALLPSALTIAFLAGIESLLSATVADRLIGSRHRSNAELLAQGAANIGAALFGGLPATGAIARTATNVQAGGKTPVAGLVHALVILLVILVAAPLVSAIALPALAALLILTAWNMAEPGKWRAHFAARPADRALLLMTLLLTVFVDLTVAIGTGVAIGLAVKLNRRNASRTEWHPREK